MWKARAPPCLIKAAPSLLDARTFSHLSTSCIHICSRLHDSRAGARVRLQPKCTGRRSPRPYPCFDQSRGASRTTRAESVGMHANLRRPCTSFYTRARAYNTDTCSVLPVCAIPPMRRMQHSYGFVRAKACSSQRAAVQRARCIASFLDARRAFDRSRSSRRVWVTKKRKRKKEEEEEVFYVCSKDKKVLWLR